MQGLSESIYLISCGKIVVDLVMVMTKVMMMFVVMLAASDPAHGCSRKSLQAMETL